MNTCAKVAKSTEAEIEALDREGQASKIRSGAGTRRAVRPAMTRNKTPRRAMPAAHFANLCGNWL
jgi:hypothetical protein